jgi:hypothetical protein
VVLNHVANRQLKIRRWCTFGLKRMLGFCGFQTVLAWIHALRRSSRDLLSGRVEVDCTDVGGDEERERGGEIKTKAIMVSPSKSTRQKVLAACVCGNSPTSPVQA